MPIFRKFFSIILVLSVLLLPVQAAGTEDMEDYVQRMLQYYLTYQEDADAEIEVLLDYLSGVDAKQGQMWRSIMQDWSYNNSQMKLHKGILPEGLPQDDSLCIVIMGYGLNQDGSMKEELIDRLVVGLSSALKYPNAYVAVTGGATSGKKDVTEAGQMARWLRNRGISNDRLIVETKAYSTTENAKNVHKILMKQYPQVENIAVVTSDYHLRQSCTMFTTMNHYAVAGGARELKLVGNAYNATRKSVDTLHSQAWGISLITGIPFDHTPETQPALSE